MSVVLLFPVNPVCSSFSSQFACRCSSIFDFIVPINILHELFRIAMGLKSRSVGLLFLGTRVVLDSFQFSCPFLICNVLFWHSASFVMHLLLLVRAL